ncbi:uncharacterized protein LOC110823333 [Carica papaya]|uniref:uncharacterized protein LOC110823333 n=1 Tax=Carica papaya TaxID=3649 RepID=UPI000B8CC201|nr:uncharacterized protein LOC110823333 [Carica papaya]
MAATFIFSLPPNPTNLPSDPSSSSSLLPFSAYRYGYIYRVKPVSAFHFRAPKITCCLSIKQTNDNSATIQNDSLDGIRVIFAAGGTGGHIYPAVAVADELKSSNSTSKILFVGLPNSMESAAIPSAGYDFTAIPAVRLARPFISPVNLLLPFHLIKATRQCCQVLRDFKPHIVVGTGGYASFSACLAAVLSGIKVVIQEQNSVPGIANWVLSLFADVIFVAFNSTVDCFPRKSKCMVVGNPVRQSLKGYVSKAVARTHFFPRSGKLAGDSEARVILVLGGSLGANAINIALLNLYSQMLAEHKNWFIIWQTGVHSFDEMDSLVRNHKRVLLTPFLHNMDLAYAAADLIVSRAGALTCYEILSAGKPSILIPSPNVAEGHQFKNASLLADVAGSKLITEDELDSITLNSAIEEILGDENLMAEMSERALKAAKCEAAATIANHIISMIEVLLRAS